MRRKEEKNLLVPYDELVEKHLCELNAKNIFFFPLNNFFGGRKGIKKKLIKHLIKIYLYISAGKGGGTILIAWNLGNGNQML